MENMRNMFLDVVVYLLFFAVQSSQGLTAIITPNKTEFVFVSGMKPSENITCESDCEIYNWSCTYSWVNSKNGKMQIYIEKNNSLINTASKENETLWCYVENGSGVSIYSGRIKIFLIDTPRNITIRSYGDIDDVQEGQGYINISCNADCNPECDRYQIYRNGAILNSSKYTRIKKDRRNSGRYQCAATNSISDSFQFSTNIVDIDIKYAPSNVRIQYWSDSKQLWEGRGYININCNADCNPECDRYQIYHNGVILNKSKDTRITKDRRNSGGYQCAASNSVSNRLQNSTNSVYIDIKYTTVILESNVKEMTINIRDILPRSVSCRIDCNFPGCNSEIIVKRNSQPYRTIQSRYSIFENRKANHSDDGTYVCMVGNRMSENNFELIIYHGPRTASVLRNNQTISGDIIEKEDNSMTIPLRCSSSCNPPCKIAWYKDGQLDLRENTVISILRDRRMSGEYQCEASGVEGKVKSAPVQVIIQYPPGIVTITPSNDTFYTKRGGQPFHDIICEADCLPECTYTWYREGNYFTRGNSLFATRSYYVYYSSSSRFQCLASNPIHYYNYSRYITVKVKDGPDNVTIISPLPAIENSTFTLTCVASCYRGCQSYSWYRDKRSINQSTQTLTIYNLSKEDRGKYECQVTDYFGTKSGYYTIYVLYGPKTVTIQFSNGYYRDLNKHLIEGKDYITITCKAECYPKCTYLFYQNEKLLNNTYKNKWVHRNMSGRYTCAAMNSILNTSRISSNYEDINIKYKPKISSAVDQTTITAPDLLHLTFSVDSFPSSNVTIYQKTKRQERKRFVTFIQSVTGQLSFNVSIESCLGQGEYRVEAVNDAGSDSFTFITDVICSPVIVRYSNLSNIGFQVGDSLYYEVDFMANPAAEVSWTFVDWMRKKSKELKKAQIQNLQESSIVEINILKISNFGTYRLELKNDLGNITWEFDIRGPPQGPTDLIVDCPGSAIISWRPGFDGGATQSFLIEYSDNSSYWLVHPLQSVVSVNNNLMSAQINDIRPNTPYLFRIRAKNVFGSAESDTTVNCTWQNNDEVASLIDNQNALVGIGLLVLLPLIATAALIAVLKLKRKRKSNNQDNSLRKQGNNSNEEDNASEIVENILYITADDAKEQIQVHVDTTQNPQNGSDVYAVVEKKPKTRDSDDQPVYTDVCKSDQEKKKPAIAAKPSKVKKEERPTVNKEGLIYVDLDLKDAPSTSTGSFVIHGADDRTQYVDIDFTRRADPPDTDNEECQNEKKKAKE